MFKKESLFVFFIFFILSVILLFDLIVNSGRPMTFDAPVHMTTFAQFAQALKDGEFPVTWSNNFANLGSPLPLFAHQTSSYLGAVLVLVTGSSILSYNILLFLSIFLSTLFFYYFLKLYFDDKAAVLGGICYHFTAYRIINIFIRGALPELLASVFLPLILIFMYKFLKEKKLSAFFELFICFTLLLLTHPMMFIVFSFVFVPYFLFLLYQDKKFWFRKLLSLILVLLLSLAVSSYYVLPLLLEMKYFYQGQSVASFASDQFLGLENYFSPNWYFYKTHPGPRGNFIKFGVLETFSIITAGVLLGFNFLKKKNVNKFILFALILSLILIFFTLPVSNIFYKNLFFLNALQFPWRMFMALSFFPGFFSAYLLNKYQNKYLLLAFLAVILILRVPQTYGKNFILQDQASFDFNPVNLHTQNLQPIWAGKSEDYPVRPKQVAILEGSGQINNEIIKNSRRNFDLTADTSLRMIDYSFYFPGWKVWVDGQQVPIEFQDPEFRGVITYTVPVGQHQVLVKYTDTKTRLLAKLITALGLTDGVLFGFFLLKYRVHAQTIIVGD